MTARIEPSTIKGFFAGSGQDMFGELDAVDRVLTLTGHFDAGTKALTAPVRVAYIGTAVYDLPKYRDKQTKEFLSRGCSVGEVCVAAPSSPSSTVAKEELEFLSQAHIVLVSGGNTLFAIRRWEETGLDVCLRAAAIRGAVLAGGSAGAICWFTSGHSDSADPTTYAAAMLRAACGAANKTGGAAEQQQGEEEEDNTSWSYIRVHGLGLLPGLLCPHHDRRESNGVLREEDIGKMMKRHPTERGIGIDHWAALVLPGDGTYEVFAVPGKQRGTNNALLPAVYVKDIVQGELRSLEMPERGRLGELLRQPSGPVVRDPFEAYYAMANPTVTSEKLLCRSH
ncbi:cyclin 1 [Trypanosoma rangeli]|uniref:Cyclin 1 n=1 Tax=Trypanosoma rangeli TaxID=5698 RepID=A0A422NV72_TRYRA|nr:cyclin 1 [Trypanosoma rangeli]RNF09349.1 cyclin 1 [Trypanosoma rangeli]|eukprot:RNF09349.1 cyclin 1 [Trypanosoma rangeli]